MYQLARMEDDPPRESANALCHTSSSSNDDDDDDDDNDGILSLSRASARMSHTLMGERDTPRNSQRERYASARATHANERERAWEC